MKNVYFQVVYPFVLSVGFCGWLQRLFLLLPFICFCNSVSAQSIVWESTFGGRVSQDDQDNVNNGRSQLGSIINTPDGGQLIGGKSDAEVGFDKTQPRLGRFDYWLVKTNKNGQKQWDKVLGGRGQEEFGAVISTPDGGYLVGGTSDSPIGDDKSEASKGGSDYWIVKLDSTGTKQWDKTLGSTNYDQLRALAAIPDGGYLLAGSSNSRTGGNKTESGNGNNDYWIVKIDSSGAVQWDKTLGGRNLDYLVNVKATADGGFLLAGETDSVTYEKDSTRFTVRTRNFNVIKIDTNGTELWNKTYYKPYNTPLKDFVSTPDGNYLLVGSNYLLKVNENGIQLLERNLSRFLQANKELESVLATPDGGYLLGTNGLYTNNNQENNRNEDFRLVKLDANGIYLWEGSYGGNGFDFLTDVILTNNGNYLLGGFTSLSDGFDKTNGIKGEFDYWVVKVKEEQKPDLISWNLRYGGTLQDNFTQVIQTVDGGYLLGGYSLSDSTGDKSQVKQGGYDFWVVKTDDKGNKIWDKTYGGTGNDYLNSILELPEGGFLLGGSSESGIGGDKTETNRGSRDFWVIRLDYKGDLIWDHTYGGTGTEELRKIRPLPRNGYLVAGSSNSPVSGDKSQPSQGLQDYWLLRIDNQGQKLWDQRYGGNSNDNLADLLVSPDGSILLGGTSNSRVNGNKTQASRGGSDYWVVKTDSTGQLLWDKRFGGSEQDNLFAIASSPTGEYLLAGQSLSEDTGDKSQPSQGNQDFWLVKINNNGNKIWDKAFGGKGKEELRSLVITREGGYVLGGTSFSGRNGNRTQNTRGGGDYWLVKTDSSGAQLWDYRFGGNGDDELRMVQETREGGLIIGGRTNSGIGGDKTQPNWGNTDYWLVRLSATGVGYVNLDTPPTNLTPPLTPPALATTLNFIAYPNPFSTQLKVHFKVPRPQTITAQIYDGKGLLLATLFEGEVQANKTYAWQWQPPTFVQPGLYFLRVQTYDKVYYQKVLLAR
ncbi:T9SS type A sorting domain-containing protein [Adhaeribacter radiodurans]|uniref:T9SS type A sorting domain-containing protein n=1 Tax=Adhaeribacter radiodurans TaxID=2745197 RepID=A0A7L7L9Z0_9BACT|nr:T9SS type A sorting domain-containing protein [Adhaeribacter radiodurans]QMU29534.1 T9SS type A sorting domain-containing protein [Adhaeribacter radiodurans]